MSKKRLGKQKPQYKFFLNPHTDARFTRCPKCDAPTKLRKKPLFICVQPAQPLSINKTCRYCPACDLLIVHKDELDELINGMCYQHYPHLVGHDYLVVGTLDRKGWKEGLQSSRSWDEILKPVHDFKQHLEFEPARYMWVKED